MIDFSTFLTAKYPSSASWSPDGQMITYILSGFSDFDIMLYSVTEAKSWPLVPSIAVPRFLARPIHLSWSTNGKEVVFSKLNDYYIVPASGGEPQVLVRPDLSTKASTLSPDMKNLAFVKDGAIWIKPVSEMESYKLTKKLPGMERWGTSEAFPEGAWSPDGKKIAIPIMMRDICIASIENGDIEWVSPSDQMNYRLVWSHHSNRFAFITSSFDEKKSELCVSSTQNDEVNTLTTVYDEKWVGSRGVRAPAWSHDDRMLSFVSNKNGNCHLFVTPFGGGETRQLTNGSYEVITFQSYSVLDIPDDLTPCWSPNDSKIAFVTNRYSPHQRHLSLISSIGGEAREITSMKGVTGKFEWSGDGRKIIFFYSGPAQTTSLWIAKTLGMKKPIPVYKSLPEGVNEDDFAHIDSVTYKSSDGTMVPAVLMTPRNLNKNKKHPAIVFVYGLGFQLALLSQNVYTIEPLLDDYLVRKGYIVLRIDPRGTCWHGKDFETAVHYEAGGADVAVQDVAWAAKYLASLGYVDPKRIGLTGLSWGGWMTALTLVQVPHAFHAGLSRAGVYDLLEVQEYAPGCEIVPGMYAQRWGDVERRPDLTEKWSPINHVDDLKAVVFVVHGEMDMNAPFSEAKKFVNALIRAGKQFEFMMYPDEPHGFVSVHAFKDYFERFVNFFDTHLEQ